jgi:hypothetical protein
MASPWNIAVVAVRDFAIGEPPMLAVQELPVSRNRNGLLRRFNFVNDVGIALHERGIMVSARINDLVEDNRGQFYSLRLRCHPTAILAFSFARRARIQSRL